ncbi:hypothetical protein [Rhizobium sp. MHM7A]|uniref:hypothetical protein n=1 Tax=Rhizobium sp. MHM7A TaxID=2583233 RepID=UPI00110742FC|nr:hypothetical protein [Rhizobium sp. MHM7A]TLX16273.1 hypothetical protein FFR93_02795 [Rhizobium sp. MHM7A]
MPMSDNYVAVTFTRERDDDLDVIRSTSWAKDENALSIQFLSEFPEFEGRMHILEVGSGIPQYQIKATIDLPDGDQSEPGEILISTVAALQAVYDMELAGGSFEVDKVVVNGEEYSAADLAAAVGPGI